MTIDISPQTITREARGVRGRFGTDVWEQWLNAPESSRNAFLIDYGVPLERVFEVAARIEQILHDEGF